MSTYTKKTAERVGRPLDAAATVRPRNGVIAVSVCAGAFAAAGSILIGGAIGGGIGGGAGAIIGFLVSAVIAGRSDPQLAFQMVMALDGAGMTLYKAGLLAGTPTDELMRIGYGEVASVAVAAKIVVIRCDVVLGNGRKLQLEGGKFGVGTSGEAFALLAERSASVREPT